MLSHNAPLGLSVQRSRMNSFAESMSRDFWINTTALSAYISSHLSPRHLTTLRSLASKVPAIEIPTPSTQITRKRQPAQVRHKRIARSLIDLAPKIYQPTRNTSQRHNISSRFDRAAEAEEQRHPDQVQAELDGVEGGAVAGEGHGVGVGAGGADCPGAVGGVAHEAV